MIGTTVRQRTIYKGIDAISLENKAVRIVVLPSYGGKLASLYDKQSGYEWLFQSEQETLSIPPYGADFSAYDSSGFDEMFPGIDQGPHPVTGAEIPDHGEVWTLPWSCTEVENGLLLEVESPVFPYKLKKRLFLTESGIEIEYEAVNTGERSFPFIWTPHALLNMTSQSKIEVPGHLTEVINVEKGSQHLGAWGTRHSYHEAVSEKTGARLDLAKLEPLEDGTVEKFYFTEKLQEGWCSLVEMELGRKLMYRFPADQVPYLGVWKTRGGYRGEYNVALEPCTGVYDDVYVAEKIGKASHIPGNGTYKWSFTMDILDA